MSGHGDPRLLYTIGGIKAYHIQQGEESSLTPSGPQTLSLLMVPTNSPFADLSNTRGQNEAPEEDFYLHLNLPPELDLPLPATTQIYHQPPRSYLIPRWDLGPESGAFTRIEFPAIGKGAGAVTQEDIDTFETILAQCTAFLERAQAPQHDKSKGGLKAYNPADYAPGEAYAGSSKQPHGEVVLVDEENGSVVGELAEGAQIIEDPRLKQGSKNSDPVEISVSADGKRINIKPLEDDYLEMARHPAYKDSGLVQNSAAASRLIVTGSSYLSNMLVQGAESFMAKTKPNEKPMMFQPATHDRVRKINTLTTGVAGYSAKTVGQLTKYAQNAAAGLSGHKKTHHKSVNPDGTPNENYKPGLLNKSLIAFSTIADGISYSGKTILTHGGAAASAAVGHKYGAEAGSITSNIAGGVKNVGLVYIDVTGVSRRAIIKSVAKGMVVGKVKDKRGNEQTVMVGGGDGGTIQPTDLDPQLGVSNTNVPPNTSGSAPGQQVSFGNQAPPSYRTGVGESLEGQPAYYPKEKR
ncbi:senescence-associated protein-domain-containing protein [Paraphoma chrysanthemicola]|uniref:Senescence-associated protein-domain-containing protein n=1 Tax=Paraphoma chrysanthemicola TaxID=798071 RepID=A0A8K0R3H1_9PLEO|nr:senescence-associated protein-domain-containing protein [Paraphoma chrysanthemicola]